jgi:hypothetical protein
MALGIIGTSAKDIIIGAIRGAGDVNGNVTHVSRTLMMEAMEKTGVGMQEEAAVEIVTGALEAASEVRRDLAAVVRGVMNGIIQGVCRKATLQPDLVSSVARTAIRVTAAAKGDSSAAVKMSVGGAFDASLVTDFDLQKALRGVGRGVMLGAADSGYGPGAAAGNAVSAVMRGSAGAAVDAGESSRNVVRGLVSGAAEIKGVVEEVIREALESAIRTADELKIDSKWVVASVVSGGKEAARELGAGDSSAIARVTSGYSARFAGNQQLERERA